jgi:ubiquinone biosynthesis protein
MLRTIRNLFRLLAIARILARHDALAVVEDLGVARPITAVARLFLRRGQGRTGQKLAGALTDLGPSFIKLGQFASTRADLLGEDMAADLSDLQDHLPPFPTDQAREIAEAELGTDIEDLFASFERDPVSAASIAQVHYAVTTDGREVAVKILRPGVERAFRRDLDLFYWLAGLVERTQPALRRLKPIELVALFEQQVRLEMDLRLEAAAADELAENFEDDPTYRVPPVDWLRTARRVLTMGRLTGIPMDDRQALVAAGHDLQAILDKAAAIFFRQVFRDGFFHGDQHPGNMFVDEQGRILAVDFGIMGRLDHATRQYLADMMLATLDRDYRRLAEVHVEAGYLPPGQQVDVFAQALRSVCEPIIGRPLEEISFARLLAQLLQLTESFDMPVQPQLLLLQKNMMMAEGISRRLDPSLNIWTLAQPLIEDWIRDTRGPQARVRETTQQIGEGLARLPRLLTQAERIGNQLEAGGLRLHPDSLEALRGGNSGWRRFWYGIALGAGLGAAIALALAGLILSV